MTTMIRRYSGFPPEIFERNLVPRMKGVALALYLFLCRWSDKKSSLEFRATDKEIRGQTGASTRALCGARVTLQTLRLIECKREPGGEYTYWLCDPETGVPFPGDPRLKAKYRKEDASAHENSRARCSVCDSSHVEP